MNLEDMRMRNLRQDGHTNRFFRDRHGLQNIQQEDLNMTFRSGSNFNSVSSQCNGSCGSAFHTPQFPSERHASVYDYPKMPSQITAANFRNWKSNTCEWNRPVARTGHVFCSAILSNAPSSNDKKSSMFVNRHDLPMRQSVPPMRQSVPPDMNIQRNIMHSDTRMFQNHREVLPRSDTFEGTFFQNKHVAKNDYAAQDKGAIDVGYASFKEPVSLFLWTIKPVPGTLSIRVDGKKSMTLAGYWQSGIITHRINNKVVVTNTGSVYKLEGNMEVMDAISNGLTPKTAEAFWLGFPPNWEQVIADNFHDLQCERLIQARSDSDEELDLIEESPDDDDDFWEPCHHGSNNADVLELDWQGTDEPYVQEHMHQSATSPIHKYIASPISDPKSVHERSPEELSVVENVSTLQVINTPTGNKTSETNMNQGQEKCIDVENWIIKPLPLGQGIHLLGTKPNGYLWHSSAIEKRISKNKLQSSSGSIYNLKGNMDKLLAVQYEVPKEIIQKFNMGFPKEWQELVQEYFSDIFAINKSSYKHSSKKSKGLDVNVKGKIRQRVKAQKLQKESAARKPSIDKNIGNEQKLQKESAARKPSIDKKIGNEQKLDRDLVARRSSHGTKSKQCPENTEVQKEPIKSAATTDTTDIIEPRKIVLTPRGELVDLGTLGRSRSGRLIKPPLHWWARQSLSIEGDRIVVQEPTRSSSNFIKEFEEGYKHSTQKMKIWNNPQQKNKDYSRSVEMSWTKSYVDNDNNLQVNKTTETIFQKSDNQLLTDVEDKTKLTHEKAKQNQSWRPKQKLCCNKVNQDKRKVIKDDEEEVNDDIYDFDTSSYSESEIQLEKADDIINSEINGNKHQGKGPCRRLDTSENARDILQSYSKEKINNDQCVLDKSSDSDSQIENIYENEKCVRKMIKQRKSLSGVQDTKQNTKDVVKKYGIEKVNSDHIVSDKLTDFYLDSQVGNTDAQLKCFRNVIQRRKGSSKRQDTSEYIIVAVEKDSEGRNGKCDLDKSVDSDCQLRNTCARNVTEQRKRPNRRLNTNEEGVVADQENVVSSSTWLGESGNTEQNEERDNCVPTENVTLNSCKILSCDINKNLPHSPKKLYNRHADHESNCSKCTNSNSKLNKSSQLQRLIENKNQPDVVQTVSAVDLAAECHWTEEEKTRLQKACIHIRHGSREFWKNVAAEVKTKSAEACKEFYYNSVRNRKETMRNRNSKERPKVTCMTANMRTLKRKQQLQDLITQQSENCLDDLFDSTFRAKKKHVPNFEGICSDAIFEEIAIKQGKSGLETPVASTSHTYKKVIRPIATSKNMNQDQTYNSWDDDAYVHRILKRHVQTGSKEMLVEKTKPVKERE